MGLKLGDMDITMEKVVRLLREPSYVRQVVTGNARRAAAYLFHRQEYEREQRRAAGIAEFPRNVVVLLTYRCQLRCKMCNLWGEHGMLLQEDGKEKAHHHNDLPLALFRRIYDECCDRSEWLFLFGGEPTLHPDFPQMLAYLKPGKVKVSLETNGLLLARQADMILDAPIDVLNVSIDGPPEVHDRIRGLPGAYEKSMQGVRTLAERAAQRNRSLTIALRYVITDDNYDCIAAFAQTVRNEPIRQIGYQHLMYQHDLIWRQQIAFTRQHFGLDVAWDRSMPSSPRRIDPHVVLEQLDQVRRAGLPFDVAINPPYPAQDVVDYYRASEQMPEPTMDCKIIWDQITIDSRGEAMLCTTVSAGNIANATLAELWNNERYRRLRQVVRQEHHMPYCKICCYLGDKKPMRLVDENT